MLGAALTLAWAYAQAFFQARQNFGRYARFEVLLASVRLALIVGIVIWAQRWNGIGGGTIRLFLGAYIVAAAAATAVCLALAASKSVLLAGRSPVPGAGCGGVREMGLSRVLLHESGAPGRHFPRQSVPPSRAGRGWPVLGGRATGVVGRPGDSDPVQCSSAESERVAHSRSDADVPAGVSGAGPVGGVGRRAHYARGRALGADRARPPPMAERDGFSESCS